MEIEVTTNQLLVSKDVILNENEYKINDINFIFSEEYNEDLIKVALFTANGNTYKEIILMDKTTIPPEILAEKGYFLLGIYAYTTKDNYALTEDTEIDGSKTYYTRTGTGTEEDPYVYVEVENPEVEYISTYYEKEVELLVRYSPSPIRLFIDTGSYIPNEDTENSKPITASELEQYQQALNEGLREAENVNISVSKEGTIATVTITNRQGEEESVEIYDGDDYVITEADYKAIAQIVEVELDSDKNYVHVQSVASDVWNVNHNLNKYPSINIIDNEGNEVIGEVQYIDLNNIKLRFNNNFAGKVILN